MKKFNSTPILMVIPILLLIGTLSAFKHESKKSVHNPRTNSSAQFTEWWEEGPHNGEFPFHRLRNISSGKHMMAAATEAYSLYTSGWAYEGRTGYLKMNGEPGATAVYRYYNSSNGDHYFSISSTAPSGYSSEGIVGYAATTGGTFSDGVSIAGAIYVYHRMSGGADHLYTNSFSELGAGNSTWSYDGIAFYLYKS